MNRTSKQFGRNLDVCVALLGVLLLCELGCLSGCRHESPDRPPNQHNQPSERTWTLRDSASDNPTTFDPVRIVDAFTTNVLANCYEGLVKVDQQGRVVPALAESWEVSPDGKVWRFKLRHGVTFHTVNSNGKFTPPREVTSKDVVYCLTRTATSPSSMLKWVFANVVEGVPPPAGQAGKPIPGFRAPDSHTVEIRLSRPFPILNRLVMAGGWVYPNGIIEACGEDFLSHNVVGTGPYSLRQFVPDDRIELAQFAHAWEPVAVTAPSSVEIHIQSDPVAALERFLAGNLDVVEVSLGTMAKASQFAAKGKAQLVPVTANYLDYLVINNQQAPFDDVRVRKAINAAIDRDKLVAALSNTVEPAFGFIPPVSPAYRGSEAIRKDGFQFDLQTAKSLLAAYRKEKKIDRLSLELTIDAGELSEVIGQYVQDSLKRNLDADVRLRVKSWPEVMQEAFTGKGQFYRCWWNIVTPGDDIYFLFYFPGEEPPAGFNLSFYRNADFPAQFYHVFSTTNEDTRLRGVRKLEDRLITDAAAVPLFHRKFFFLLRKDLQLPINSYLRKYYAAAKGTAE